MNVARSNLPARAHARVALFLTAAAILCAAGAATAAPQILGQADGFAVLGASTVTNTHATKITGDLGVFPGSSITGLDMITLSGGLHQDDAVAHQARNDASNAFSTLAALSSTTTLTGSDLGSVGTLTPGVYTFTSSAQLTGDLTLDFLSDPGGAFVFQIGSTLTTASDSNIFVLNGGPTSAIYWAIGSSATLGTGTTFAGNILARQSITLNTGARVLCGRTIALVGAVTMDTNTVSNDCTGAGSDGSGRSDFGSHGFDGGAGGPGGAAIPEPGAWSLMLLGFGGLGAMLRVQRRHRVAAPA
ncbi:MAG: hypothetical protein JWQ29_261 [Phenylobacterium sp.]|nr:hypothetical protein [Phenylobacterium sp.]